MRVFDTGTAAGAQSLVVLHAAELARCGASLDEVEAGARRVAEQVRLLAALETLEYLIRGGRVAPVIGGLANRLRLWPMIELQPGGEIRRLRPALSRRAAMDRAVGQWRRTQIAVVPIGFSTEEAPRPKSSRRPLAEMTHHDHYGRSPADRPVGVQA